jgi:hypothetical protein
VITGMNTDDAYYKIMLAETRDLIRAPGELDAPSQLIPGLRWVHCI